MNKNQKSFAVLLLLSINNSVFAEENKPLGQLNDGGRVTGELQTRVMNTGIFSFHDSQHGQR